MYDGHASDALVLKYMWGEHFTGSDSVSLYVCVCAHAFTAGTVKFIDMEYGGPNYRGFDVADHFCEFAG